jgi:AcrR family transcriptional regulator
VGAARQILEDEGREALTMRRLAEAVGIRAPSLYKHFSDKAAVELALIEQGFTEAADMDATWARGIAALEASRTTMPPGASETDRS